MMAQSLNYHDLKFLYLRTKYDIVRADEAICALADAVSSGATNRRARMLEFNRDVAAWDNGFVLAVSSPESVADLIRALQPGLDAFESWGLLGYGGESAEAHGDGPLNLFMRQVRDSGLRGRPGQIFLMFRQRERDPDRVTDAIRTQLGRERCRPVFHFRDGCVLLCASAEPARLLARRAEKALSQLEAWSMLDSAGDALFRDSSGAWRWVELESLEFTD